MNRLDLVDGLTGRYGYAPEHAPMVAARLLRLQPGLREEFELWWAAGTLPRLEAEGYTVERLVSEFGLQPLGAILTLDWLLREPAEALEAIREGADSVRRQEEM